MSVVLDYFDIYINHGWKIIPIRPRSKAPYFKSWNADYDKYRTREFIEEHPDCNLGLLLGEIVDLEADDKSANARLNRKIRDYPHPKYKSEKSVHHLFLTPDPELTRVVIKGIEYRGSMHQSVLPASVNKNGVKYSWLTTNLVVPPMPVSLVDYYNQQTKIRHSHYAKCYQCEKDEPIHRKRHKEELEAFRQLGMRWECHKCRKVDVRDLCRKIRRGGTIILHARHQELLA